MLEAADDATQKKALLLLDAAPAIGAEHLDATLRLVARCAGSASTGVTQCAADVLGTLGTTYPAVASRCLAALEEFLHATHVPTNAQALKTLKPLVTGKGKAGTLTAAARERIAALKDAEPKKLGKLAAALE